MAHNIVSRLSSKPQMARKRQAVAIPASIRMPSKPPGLANLVNQQPKTIKPAPAPAVHQVITPVARAAQQYVAQPSRPREAIVNVVVSRPRSLRKQQIASKGPIHVTQDVSGYDLEKIRNILKRGTGKILVIIGNGPSVSEVPLELLNGYPQIDTMTINSPDMRIWPTTYWSFFDRSQFTRHRTLWDSYNGTVFNSPQIKAEKPSAIKIKNIAGLGFSLDLTQGLHIGRSSVYGAMQIALWLDYAHVYICGVDMCEVNGKMHFYGVNPDVEPNVRKGRFDREAEFYNDAANRLAEEHRKRFTFCSSHNPYSFPAKFNKLDHNVAIATIIQHARELYNGQHTEKS